MTLQDRINIRHILSKILANTVIDVKKRYEEGISTAVYVFTKTKRILFSIEF